MPTALTSDQRLAVLEHELSRLRRRQWIFCVIAACAIAFACKSTAAPLTKIELGGVKLDSTGLTIEEGPRKVSVTSDGTRVTDGANQAKFGSDRAELKTGKTQATLTVFDRPRLELQGENFHALLTTDKTEAVLSLESGELGAKPDGNEHGPRVNLVATTTADKNLAYVDAHNANNGASLIVDDTLATVTSTSGALKATLAPTNSVTPPKKKR